MNSGGSVSKPVYVVQDERMPEEDFEVYEVPGIGIGVSEMQSGCLVFMKSRAGNSKFFKWLNKEVIIPYIIGVRKALGLTT